MRGVLKSARLIFSQFWRPEVQNGRVGKIGSLWRPQRRLLHAPSLGSACGWQSSGSLGSETHHPGFCCFHVAFSSLMPNALGTALGLIILRCDHLLTWSHLQWPWDSGLGLKHSSWLGLDHSAKVVTTPRFLDRQLHSPSPFSVFPLVPRVQTAHPAAFLPASPLSSQVPLAECFHQHPSLGVLTSTEGIILVRSWLLMCALHGPKLCRALAFLNLVCDFSC